MPVVDLEELFREELKGYFLNPKEMSDFLNRTDSAVAEKAKLLETLRREQQTLKQEMDATFELYHAQGLSIDQFKQRYKPLDVRKLQLEAEVPRVEAELAVLKIDGYSAETIKADALQLYTNWPTMTPEQKREIVEMLVKRIVISGEDIAITLCYHPSSKKLTEEQHMLKAASTSPRSAAKSNGWPHANGGRSESQSR
jgi:site-specific DNA recombinase